MKILMHPWPRPRPKVYVWQRHVDEGRYVSISVEGPNEGFIGELDKDEVDQLIAELQKARKQVFG